jgi:transcriptional regulator with XRE-family HTH domain
MPRPIVDPRFAGRLRQLRTERGLSLRQLAAAAYLSKTHLSDFERGTRTPTPGHVAALDAALSAGGALTALLADPGPAELATADQYAAALSDARRLEDQVGAAPMLTTASNRLAAVEALARAAGPRTRSGLVMVTGQWAQFAGWVHLAAGRYGRGRRLLSRALECATEGGDRELVATVLSFLGHAEWLDGRRVTPLLGLTEAALRDPAIHVGQRAYDHYQLARGHALLGDRIATVETLAAAADLTEETLAYTGPRPPWHYYRTRPFFDLEAALVHGVAGDRCRAEELLAAGLAGLPAELATAKWVGMYRAAVSAS